MTEGAERSVLSSMRNLPSSRGRRRGWSLCGRNSVNANSEDPRRRDLPAIRNLVQESKQLSSEGPDRERDTGTVGPGGINRPARLSPVNLRRTILHSFASFD